MKTYPVKPNKILLKNLKKYWAKYQDIESKRWESISRLEGKMRKETGIKTLEFFFCDGDLAGIGTEDRDMKLIHRKG